MPDTDERLLLDEDITDPFRLLTSSGAFALSSAVLAVVVLAVVGAEDACELLLVVAVLDIECLCVPVVQSRGGLPGLLLPGKVVGCDSSGTMPRREGSAWPETSPMSESSVRF